MSEIISEVLRDTLPMIPILFLSYLFIEWYEHRSDKSGKVYQLLERKGPLIGALFGLIPQCGFSVVAATLFVERKITIGALIAVFIATSDEAIPILLSHPEFIGKMFVVMLIKFVLALSVGYIVDAIWSKSKLYVGKYDKKSVDHDEHDHSIMKEALIRTVKIFGYVVLVNLILTTALYLIGEERLESVLLSGSMLQPVIAALIGFIPNCASSIVVTQLYVSGIVTFGAMMAGLITNAGIGLMVLLRYKIEAKSLLRIISVLFIVALVSAYTCIFLGL